MTTKKSTLAFSPWLQGRVKELFPVARKSSLIWVIYKLIEKVDNAYADEVYRELKRRIEN